MVVGISDDLINPPVSHFCHLCAQVCFIFSVSITFAFVPVSLLAWFVVKPLSLPDYVNLISFALITFCLFIKLVRKLSNDSPRSIQRYSQ